MINLYLNAALITLVYVSLWFILASIIRRNDIMDIAWGPGFLLVSLYLFFSGSSSPRSLLITILIFLWALRLAIYIGSRNRGKTEDFRYLNWRNTWKLFYLRSYFQIYILQGTLLLFIAAPIVVTASAGSSPLNILDFAGLAVWLFGMIFETVGDWQMSRFKSDPANRGKIMTTGLWRYTRHPNYFGEVVLWWGIFIISLSSNGWFYGLIGPITISFLILFVSGIPMLEEKYRDNPEFQEYKRKTSSFFPMPPRK